MLHPNLDSNSSEASFSYFAIENFFQTFIVRRFFLRLVETENYLSSISAFAIG